MGVVTAGVSSGMQEPETQKEAGSPPIITGAEFKDSTCQDLMRGLQDGERVAAFVDE
jgi:hypothetical protein